MPKAIELLRESAALGYGTAKINLSLFLYNYGVWVSRGGNCAEEDRPKAVKLLIEAALLGNETARHSLGLAGLVFE